jgi:hypothetical protein
VVILPCLRRFDDTAQNRPLAQAALRRRLAQAMRVVFTESHGRFEAVAFEALR